MQHIRSNKIYAVVVTLALIGVLLFVMQVRINASPADPEPGSSLSDRVKQRKAEQTPLGLEEKVITRLERQCTRGQSALRQLQNPKIDMLSKRQQTYEKISGKAWLALGSIKIAEKDVFNLKRHTLKLDDQIDAFQNNSNNYNQVVGDILQMNCSADVIGFMSLVETARFYNQSLRAQALEIRETINVDIREELDSLAKQL